MSAGVAHSSGEFFAPERLAALPLKALVAFAARCARRVEPAWSDLDSADRRQLERAIYALACACCETPKDAAIPALLAAREAHFAAGGDSRDLEEAEKHFEMANRAPQGSVLWLVAMGIRRDLDCVVAITDRRPDDPIVRPEFFGPLWPSGAPSGWPDE